jgi:hypothetical protein
LAYFICFENLAFSSRYNSVDIHCFLNSFTISKFLGSKLLPVFITRISETVFLPVWIDQILFSIESSLDTPILHHTHGKAEEEKFEQRFSYLHQDAILQTLSFPTINVSNTSQV